MKTEQGFIIEVTNDVAKIKVGRHSDCKNCGACPGDNSVIIKADNKIGANLGQRVVFEVKEAHVLRAAFIVFMLPLIFIFLGALLGRSVGMYFQNNVYVSEIVGGIVAFIFSMGLIKIFDKSTSKKKQSLPKIIRILQ